MSQPVFAPLYNAIPGPLAGMFLVGLTGVTETVVAEIELCYLFKAKQALALTAALQLEKKFLTGIIDFEEPAAPATPNLTMRERMNLATACCMNRPLCVVVCNAYGQVAAGRNFQHVEQTRMMRARAEMEAHIVALKRKFLQGSTPPSSP